METLPEILVVGPLPALRFAGLVLPTYFVYMSLLLSGLAYFVYRRAVARGVSVNDSMDLFLVLLASGGVGARVFHIVYEAPAYYLANPIRVLYFWQGGFVYFAGLLGGILGGWLFVRRRKWNFFFWADFLAPAVSLGYALGRVACFLEGCCYGQVCSWPWSYGFGQVDLSNDHFAIVHRHPTQLYAMALELCVFALLLFLERGKRFKQAGGLFMFWLGVHGLSRIAIEQFRDDDRGFMFLGLSVSTLVGIVLVSVSLAWFSKRKLAR